MDIKATLKAQFGSCTRFARILGAPLATIHSWTRTKTRRTPAKWQLEAYIDAANYRSKSVDGWKCRSCGSVTTDPGEGIKPPFCGVCGSSYLSPVAIIHKTEKETQDGTKHT